MIKIILLLLLSHSCAFYLHHGTLHKSKQLITSLEAVEPSFKRSHLSLKEQSKDTDIEATSTSSRTSKQEDTAISKTVHYPTEGGMYDISEGPGLHLINVDHDRLHDLEEMKSVNVYEVKVDAVTVTFASFASLAMVLLLLAFSDEGILLNFVARVLNYFK